MPSHRLPACANRSVTLNASFCAITSVTRYPFPYDNLLSDKKGGYGMEEEIRKGAIMDYVKGQPPKDIYTRLNRSKKWFFKWLKRYQTGNVEWYKEYSYTHLRAH